MGVSLRDLLLSRILRFSQGKNKKVYARLQLCLLPEQLEVGHQPFFGERELIQTDMHEWHAVSDCIGAVNVHSLAGYQKLKTVQPWDHFSRFSLNANERRFFPETLKVFCTCNIPYNPDLYMAECTSCHEWFHPECVGEDPEEIENGERTFLCNTCGADENEEDAVAANGKQAENGEPSL